MDANVHIREIVKWRFWNWFEISSGKKHYELGKWKKEKEKDQKEEWDKEEEEEEK